MASPTAIPHLTSDTSTSTASSWGLTTPSCSLDDTVRDLGGEITPTGKRREGDITAMINGKKDLDRAMMPPPPLPVTSVYAPTPPRMNRMPSLSEITSHLHIPSPLASSTPKTPPRLSLLTTPSASPVTADPGPATSPYTASPSGRLKLPASAMTRTRSGSSSQTPTLASLSTPRTELERRGSGDGQPGSGEASKTASPESAKNSPLSHADVPSPQLGSTNADHKRQERKEYVQRYKDTPSLATIRQRISFSKGSDGPGGEAIGKLREAGMMDKKEVDESAIEAGELESVETLLEEKAASGSETAVANTSQRIEHPLQHPWTLYFDAKSYMPPLEQSAGKNGGTGMGDYEKSLLSVGKIDTVEAFARHMNNLRLPSHLKQNSNYHLFKGNIRPMWEDPANSNGGKWVILFRQASHLLDLVWANLTMALLGQILDPDDMVCGIVASNRPKVDRLQVWTRGREDVEGLNALGRRCLEMMGAEKGEMESVSIEFQYNASNAHPPPNAFLHIPFPSRNFTHSPSTPSRLGAGGSPILNLPSSGSAHISPSPSLANPSPIPLLHHIRSSNLSINITPHNHNHQTHSPLSHNTRAENRPISPGITPTPSPKMMHSLPRAPDTAMIKASMITPGTTSPSLNGGDGTGMRRLGSDQGANAFSGPMAGSRSPRSGENRGLAPPSPVPAYRV